MAKKQLDPKVLKEQLRQAKEASKEARKRLAKLKRQKQRLKAKRQKNAVVNLMGKKRKRGERPHEMDIAKPTHGGRFYADPEGGISSSREDDEREEVEAKVETTPDVEPEKSQTKKAKASNPETAEGDKPKAKNRKTKGSA